jgi:putative nucleotidyltransferase with HDIG domain
VPESHCPGDHIEIYGCTACFNPMILTWSGGEIQAKPTENARDLRVVAPPGSIGANILDELPKSLQNLPVLPEISRRVLSMVNNPEAALADVVNLIREDQVIALKIMQLANSPTYGGLREIKDLNAACARLGMKTIANTVQAVASSNLYITGDKTLSKYMRDLWRHSVATAYLAHEVAALLAVPKPETLFLAGLFHDIGKVVLLDIFANNYSGPLGVLRSTPEIFQEVVQGFHPGVGLHVVQSWGLPAEFVAITFCHMDPSSCPNEDWCFLSHIVALADTIAHVEGFTPDPVEEIVLVSHPSARFLNLTDIKIASLRADLAEKLESLLEVVSG